jgi:hypothetical protein
MSDETVEPNNAYKTLHILETKVGNSERSRHIDVNGAFFLRTLLDIGGTFVWEDGPKKGDQFANVFEALATQTGGYTGLGLMARAQHVEEYAPRLRSGFYSARKWMQFWFLDTVYSVPQNRNSNLPTVVTINQDFVLECGATAAQMQEERDIKLAEGQVLASARRMVSTLKSPALVIEKIQAIMQRLDEGVRLLSPQKH